MGALHPNRQPRVHSRRTSVGTAEPVAEPAGTSALLSVLKVADILENATGDVLWFACQPADITRRWTPSFSVGRSESNGATTRPHT